VAIKSVPAEDVKEIHGITMSLDHTIMSFMLSITIIILVILGCPFNSTLHSVCYIVALQRLRHPNIVRLYDVIQQVENTLLIMEFMAGGEFALLREYRIAFSPLRQA
jgi:serine/threonine protein kinase